MKKKTFFLMGQPGCPHLSVLRNGLRFCAFCLGFLALPMLGHAQFFEDLSCNGGQTSPPSSPEVQLTLCQQNMGFVPDVTVGSSSTSQSNSSSLPLTTLPNGDKALVNKKVLINGTLNVNVSFVFKGCTVKMGPAALIQTQSGKKVDATQSKFFACNQMWKGFNLPTGTASMTLFDCKIEDADKAIKVADGVPLKIDKCDFNRNLYGIYNGNATAGTGMSISQFTNNNFTCTSILNSQFPNQSGYNDISIAGIFVKNSIATFPSSGSPNSFSKMEFGIQMDNSEVGFKNFSFKAMVVDNGVGGVGVKATSGKLTAAGGGGEFLDNPVAGIDANGTHLDVSGYKFNGDQNKGIRSTNNALAQFIKLIGNTFTINAVTGTAEYHGIYLVRPLASGTQIHAQLEGNTFTLNGAKKCIAMEVLGAFPASDNFVLADNYVYINNTNQFKVHGILMSGGTTNNNRINSNHIYYYSDDNGPGLQRRGIQIVQMNGTGSSCYRNEVIGTANTLNDTRFQCGFHVYNSKDIWFCNNTTEDADRGYHFTGDCDNSVFSNNIIEPSTHGLYVDSGPMGKQFRAGNIWSTAANAFSAAAAKLEGTEPADS
ncbi:MAG: hypothetical protein IT258_14065 [Saprospiraceae bacterium]|nr:hypothetical protein [Saprospiraceae bacterium]